LNIGIAAIPLQLSFNSKL